MIKMKKNPGENNEHIYRRFRKNVKEARFVNELKRERYHKKAPTRTKMRARALMRDHYRAQRRKQLMAE